MNISEEMKPSLEELKTYSLRLFEFISENCNKPVTYLRQMEFNCLFRIYSNQINFICDTFNVEEEDLTDFLIKNDDIDKIANENPEMENAVDVFMTYVDGFAAAVENFIPQLPN